MNITKKSGSLNLEEKNKLVMLGSLKVGDWAQIARENGDYTHYKFGQVVGSETNVVI